MSRYLQETVLFESNIKNYAPISRIVFDEKYYSNREAN